MAARGRGHARVAVRQDQRGPAAQGQAGLLGAVPPRSLAGPTGQPLPLRAVRGADGESVSASASSSLPPCGGGLGWGVATECGADDVDNAIRILQDLVVPEAEDAEALPLQKGCSDHVGCAFRVLPAVDFDDKARFQTNEVGDVLVDRDLAAKSMSIELLSAQSRPELRFTVGWIAAELSTDTTCHDLSRLYPPSPTTPPPPPPPPPGGEGLTTLSPSPAAPPENAAYAPHPAACPRPR